MSFAQVIPLAFVMVAGPQILSSIFLATSESWKRNSALFVFGASLSITTVTTISYLLGNGASDGGSDTPSWLYWVIIVLLLGAMLHTYLTRGQSDPPKWMGDLENADGKFSFRLGFLLLGVFPTDILTSLAVGAYVSGQGESWFSIPPFVAVALLFLATPALIVVAFGERAEVWLPEVRDWMNNNSWVVNEVVLALFVLLTASNL